MKRDKGHTTMGNKESEKEDSGTSGIQRKKGKGPSQRSGKSNRDKKAERREKQKETRVPDSMPWSDIPVTVQIGKEGLSEGITKELIKQLRTRRRVKVKFLRSVIHSTRKEEAKRLILEKTGAACEKMIGFTILLRKDDKK